MTITISPDHNNARLLATRDFLDSGSSAAKLRIYGGTRPSAGASPGTPMLAEITLDEPCGTIVSNALQLTSSGGPSIVTNSGTPTWARFVNGNGDWAIDCNAGVTGSGAPVIVSDETLLAGGDVILISAVLS